jgi:hypothetical protein
MRKAVLGLISAGVALLATPVLAAPVLPDTSWTSSACSGNNPCVPVTVQGVTSDAKSDGPAHVELFATPSIAASASAGAASNASGQLIYFIEVVGPGSGIIPLNVSAYTIPVLDA